MELGEGDGIRRKVLDEEMGDIDLRCYCDHRCCVDYFNNNKNCHKLVMRIPQLHCVCSHLVYIIIFIIYYYLFYLK